MTISNVISHLSLAGKGLDTIWIRAWVRQMSIVLGVLDMSLMVISLLGPKEICLASGSSTLVSKGFGTFGTWKSPCLMDSVHPIHRTDYSVKGTVETRSAYDNEI